MIKIRIFQLIILVKKLALHKKTFDKSQFLIIEIFDERFISGEAIATGLKQARAHFRNEQKAKKP